MPASTIVASGGSFRLYGNAVQTFDTLPVATYAIAFNSMSGYSLRETVPLSPGNERVYGNHLERVKRIMRGYEAVDRSWGVLLSGDKGMGKSLMIRLLAERARDELALPTILVQHATPGLASFLDELGECVVVFDEFEKVFPKEGDEEAQNQFLSLFDGLSTTKRMYVLSVNHLHLVNDFMLNRPGRFHYHMRFEYPDVETVAQYLRDQVPDVDERQINEVVDFSRKYDINFDHLRAIAFELRLGETFSEVIGDLNIKRADRRGGDVVQAHITWADGETDVISDGIDLFNLDARQSIRSWDHDMSLRFRMRDAIASQDGYLLPPDAYEIIDEKDDDTDEESRSLDVVSVVLRRPAKQSIDF